MVKAQSGMRGYLITGDDVFIKEIENIELESNTYFDNIKSLTVDNPSQQLNLVRLKPLRTNFFNYIKNRIANKKTGTNTITYNLTFGQKMMNNINEIGNHIENNENKLLAERNVNSKKYGL